MTKLLSVLLLACLISCSQGNSNKEPAAAKTDMAQEKAVIAATLDSFNVAAANADYNRYFNFFTADATFIGTDATENWDKAAFMTWAKPHFDKKATWNFKAIKRNIYFAQSPDIAWFDELLNTQMKLCRGSGVMVKQNGEWKVQQYVLSMTIPNDHTDDVIKLKAPLEDSLMKTWLPK